ncbi:unnamed protein product [Protopolystoma xenopodis]|uniref:Fibronectin type-III domain-containing protein n=1 Tax=Protopolystoma xenopodis TaxID=117903 RepID=A0A3S5BNZ9_9PLAT|nr:unnamed protein product [Protopolystoma xenopodis]
MVQIRPHLEGTLLFSSQIVCATRPINYILFRPTGSRSRIGKFPESHFSGCVVEPGTGDPRWMMSFEVCFFMCLWNFVDSQTWSRFLLKQVNPFKAKMLIFSVKERAVPSQPVDLMMSSILEREVVLNWEKPLRNYASISSYMVAVYSQQSPEQIFSTVALCFAAVVSLERIWALTGTCLRSSWANLRPANLVPSDGLTTTSSLFCLQCKTDPGSRSRLEVHASVSDYATSFVGSD